MKSPLTKNGLIWSIHKNRAEQTQLWHDGDPNDHTLTWSYALQWWSIEWSVLWTPSGIKAQKWAAPLSSEALFDWPFSSHPSKGDWMQLCASSHFLETLRLLCICIFSHTGYE